jgi:hypothetical protein
VVADICSLRLSNTHNISTLFAMSFTVDIKRIPYEEPYLLNLIFNVSSGSNSFELEVYEDATQLSEYASHLTEFPRHNTDTFNWVLGSEYPEDRYAYFFRLRAYLIDSACHSAMHFRVNNNEEHPDKIISEFSFLAEPNQINAFGRLLKEFSKFQHSRLLWGPDQAELIS